MICQMMMKSLCRMMKLRMTKNGFKNYLLALPLLGINDSAS